jgi:tetratricopeptide (TPR) repeat protein
MPSITRPLLQSLTLLCWTLAAALSCAAQGAQTHAPGQGQKPERLREEYAMRFLEPEPHMALARHFRDAGKPLLAFNVLEGARRGRFPKEEFDRAFKTYFLGEKPFANDAEAEAKLLAQLAQAPESHEALFGLADVYVSRGDWAKAKQYLGKLAVRDPAHFEHTEALAEVYRREGNTQEAKRLMREWARAHPATPESYQVRLSEIPETEDGKAKELLTEAAAKFPGVGGFQFYLAGIHLREGRLKEAERLYVKAAELSPDSADVQAWVGRFFFKAMPDDRRALDYYLRAYLLNPHAYETEFVESRIPTLGWRLAEARLREQLKRGVPLTAVVEDPSPYVSMLALEEMLKGWKPVYLKTVVALMAHDDGGVRWQATEVLKAKADASFDPALRALLQDADLRRRGLAAYVAVHRWKAGSFDHMRRMLREEAQLLRFDAVSALILEGGPEGRKIARDHATRETLPQLKKLVESAKGQESPPE